ncbi:hypothetical protein PPERSA_10156 [Pseudocohnilembus persalinus]|uniref:Uncharacterized protein n=1 Tax=Pseudocohnilembus persalinus TaxID=266149 RepID=A0A0V0QL66_PSEPJ|nr:hypothetical protein PPERSA_10156 [Pseudocohnilembus persalinus]|eukprot:KRX03075.1 hypothetical protein PPERSA_10156 [Pseudocohnilembus persalinus]
MTEFFMKNRNLFEDPSDLKYSNTLQNLEKYDFYKQGINIPKFLEKAEQNEQQLNKNNQICFQQQHLESQKNKNNQAQIDIHKQPQQRQNISLPSIKMKQLIQQSEEIDPYYKEYYKKIGGKFQNQMSNNDSQNQNSKLYLYNQQKRINQYNSLEKIQNNIFIDPLEVSPLRKILLDEYDSKKNNSKNNQNQKNFFNGFENKSQQLKNRDHLNIFQNNQYGFNDYQTYQERQRQQRIKEIYEKGNKILQQDIKQIGQNLQKNKNNSKNLVQQVFQDQSHQYYKKNQESENDQKKQKQDEHFQQNTTQNKQKDDHIHFGKRQLHQIEQFKQYQDSIKSLITQTQHQKNDKKNKDRYNYDNQSQGKGYQSQIFDQKQNKNEQYRLNNIDDLIFQLQNVENDNQNQKNKAKEIKQKIQMEFIKRGKQDLLEKQQEIEEFIKSQPQFLSKFI